MENLEKLSVAEMEAFVANNRRVKIEVVEGESGYQLIECVLYAQRYSKLSRREKGIVRQYLRKVSGLSRAQLTRLIERWRQTRKVKRKPASRPHFPTRYTAADIALLAKVDAAHEDLSGPAVSHILKREFEVYGKAEYERLSKISPSHIYNLRQSEPYRKVRVKVRSTRARQVSIGERRAPEPKGRPGYVRVDTVHQGIHDGKPGVYHIDAVDSVTQWQVVGCVETICERDLIPVLEAMLHQFPFVIRGFHSDNGSEFLNQNVVGLLNKLRVGEFTKSRAYRSTDNAQVEGKNGAVIRKHIGYGPIGAEHAEQLQKFYTAYLNPYLNFHRPCGYATVKTDERGKRKRAYRPKDYRTPYEKLMSLPEWEKDLKAGMTAEYLARQAAQMSDTEAAVREQKVRVELLKGCRESR